jgi:hypothetical protein
MVKVDMRQLVKYSMKPLAEYLVASNLRQRDRHHYNASGRW